MKKALLVIFICTLNLLFGTACGVDHIVENDKVNTDSDDGSLAEVTSEIDFALYDIPLLDYFSNNDEIGVLDVKDRFILFVVSERVTWNEVTQRPEFIYKYICVYDYVNGNMEYQKALKENENVFTGTILDDQSIAYCSLGEISIEGLVAYTIRYMSKNNEIIVDQGLSNYGPSTAPYFITIEDTLIYSYENIVEDTSYYGIKSFDPNTLDITEIYKQVTDVNHALISTELKGNNKEFIYFTEQNKQGIFLIGNESEITNQFPLESDEKVDNYCLLDNHVVFTFEVTNTDNNQYRELQYKDFTGNVVANERLSLSGGHSFYRMTSNYDDTLLCIDVLWNLYCIRVVDNALNIEPVTFPRELNIRADQAYAIYNIDQDNFSLYFYDDPSLLLISISDDNVIPGI